MCRMTKGDEKAGDGGGVGVGTVMITVTVGGLGGTGRLT